MYIPDSIHITKRGQKLVVFSADSGHENDPALQVTRVMVQWDEFRGISATVEYGTRIEKLGEPMPRPASVDYPVTHITFDL